ncbi:cupin domain-containing protein [Terriglobus albidus]|uniref:Cupin domain-containing protein n=1 Tax=Terriglobus albidus TaxID=1592106 RepID=A0A5B9EF88_9BACT|nr:cupin domain-containing protein [Terriglobus albidus]QEE30449.1 cupin domain-containing protein [Terriglobus albidus]
MPKIVCGFAALLFGCGIVNAQTAPAAASTPATTQNPLARAGIFPYDQMAVRKTANGTESRNAFTGTLATGETVAVHESMQPAGTAPVELHRIGHSELIVVQEGTVAFEHDGKEERVGPGGLVYVALGTVHRIKNVGDVPAKYVVIAIGGDAKK